MDTFSESAIVYLLHRIFHIFILNAFIGVKAAFQLYPLHLAMQFFFLLAHPFENLVFLIRTKLDESGI